MVLVVNKSVCEEINNYLLKSHKYIRRWKVGDKWRYEMPKDQKRNIRHNVAKNEIAKKTKLITGIKPLTNATEQDIDEALVQLSIYAMDGKLKCPALGNHSVYITERTQDHIKRTKGTFRPTEEMYHKAKYIPFIPEILKNGKLSEKSMTKEGVIFGIIGQVEYFDDKKNKTVREYVELAINFDKDTRKYVFSFSDDKIKKSLPASKDFSKTTFLVCPVGACIAEAFSTTNNNIQQNNSVVKKSVYDQTREILTAIGA